MKLLVGIRNSKLSNLQSEIVIQEISKYIIKNEHELSVKHIKTMGDIKNTERLDKLGGKGLFAKEIEDQLIRDEIQLAVHSLKDLPSKNTNGLDIVAFLMHTQRNDVLISNSGKKLANLSPGSTIGTSSIRRRSQILRLRKDLNIKLLRGNVDTRIKKLRELEYDAIILSYAGIARLGFGNIITEILDFENFMPAACQGIIGVQTTSNSQHKEILKSVNQTETNIIAETEREVLRLIGANCNSPVSVLAQIKRNKIELACQILDHHGNLLFKGFETDDQTNSIKLAYQMSEQILSVVGQKNIDDLDNLKDDFDYSPKH
ncbi:hydroxymethylbilane synthase [Acinetobacter sp. UBA6526]|uniref:hydroxymethylbilane synthase n=1 Tax=Acinetobacter sp. UBA6526 TaxID=1945950 RepID=UPI00257DF906|nr:hydroxymethylbilane synthase [Acinetobacter sp. UBA6526]|tara:strand:+ start:157 stop:1110 length:954 start_codon:yes stop_codon:yes gene_type:complete